MAYNSYQSYYNGTNKDKEVPGLYSKSCRKYDAKVMNLTLSERQTEYHKLLINFLKEKGVDNLRIFEKPRSRSDCSKKISALRTIVLKNGWGAEFYGKVSNDG